MRNNPLSVPETMLPEEAIEEFKDIYFRLYGMRLSDAEARRRAENIVRLYEAVYGPDPTGPIRDEEDE